MAGISQRNGESETTLMGDSLTLPLLLLLLLKQLPPPLLLLLPRLDLGLVTTRLVESLERERKNFAVHGERVSRATNCCDWWGCGVLRPEEETNGGVGGGPHAWGIVTTGGGGIICVCGLLGSALGKVGGS